MANPPNDDASRRENFAYLMIGKHLHQKGVPVPGIYTNDLKHGWFVMEDMGSTSLQDVVSSNKRHLPIYEELLEHLLRLQIAGTHNFDPAWCNQTERYDRHVMIKYEANYFRDAFLHLYLGLKREWPELEVPFNHLAETASRADSSFLLHRDFQSRNIMISDGKIGIIDWQGARLGPLGYDLASLLIDPYIDLPHQDKNAIFEHYLLLIKEHNATWIESFKRHYPYLAIQRNLQILGAFSYLTKTMEKPYFETYIPAALRTLNDLLYEVNDPELSPLSDLLRDLNPY
jgi:aminoglycoside/choline kinase family phosphotransferase